MSQIVDDYEVMNPDIREVQIGVRQLFNLTIFPLSFAQQVEVSNIITKAVMEFIQREDQQGDAAVAAFAINLLIENAGLILEFVTDPDEVDAIKKATKSESILFSITNKQLVDIAGIMYKDNFEDVSKKVLDLFDKVKNEYLSQRSPQDSSDTILSTDLSTSSEDHIEEEDLQSDK